MAQIVKSHHMSDTLLVNVATMVAWKASLGIILANLEDEQ